MHIKKALPTVSMEQVVQFVDTGNVLKPFSISKLAWKAWSPTELPTYVYSSLPDGSFMQYELDSSKPRNISMKQVLEVTKSDNEMWYYGSVQDIKKLY